ncbi:uncharacterized protein LOC116292849 [Actinia tenebrosa]|uniref:Uncharacterized protein LOC116292849 n=1 Tax=Actinia tenebrosa TaxID=6105 RepID=A0A6P8HTP1_ACTTE|nr:uncharacterized protein LOC116292849 [Actinia tenebrosa]
MKILIVLALPLLVVWSSAGTDVTDSLTLRVFNKDLSLSDEEMHKIVKKADLEGHGYLKEVTTTVKRRPGSSAPDYVKTYYYYKVVACDKVMEVEKELDKLLNGLLGSSVARKLKKDVRERKIMSGKKCKAGVEIHYRSDQHCGKRKSRLGKRSPCGWWSKCCKCHMCNAIQVVD